MKTFIEYYCEYCKAITEMRVSGPVKHLDIYWLKCKSCKHNWSIPIEKLENPDKETVKVG